MPRIGEVKARRALRALTRLGFEVAHRDGSHRLMRHADGRTLLFAFHDAETIGPKALGRMLKAAKITLEEFRSAF